MKNQGIHLSWIVVTNFKAALEFYTEVAGFTIKEQNFECGWAELSGEGGTLLGLCEQQNSAPIKAGSNAILTLTVDNIEEARHFFQKKGVKLIGEIEEVPGHVKLQTFADADGNIMQLAQKL